MTRHNSCRVSPFGHPRINARLAAPRGLSQPPTSFIGSQCQGIHHAPLNTYKHKTNIRNCTSTRQPPLSINSRKGAGGTGSSLARCSQPLSTNQTPHTPPPSGATTTHPQPGARSPPVSPAKGARQNGHGGDGLVVSKPNSVSGDSFTGPSRSLGSRTGENVCCAPNRTTHYRRRRSSPNHRVPLMWGWGNNTGAP